MRIKVSGKSLKTPNCLVKEAATSYCEFLLNKRLFNSINLSIEFEKMPKNSGEYAYCDFIGDNHRPKDFIITINEILNKRETLLALAHECVHLSQYAKGELKDMYRPSKMTKWQGQFYDCDNLDYWFLPWEIQAYGMEKGLYFHFLKSIKK